MISLPEHIRIDQFIQILPSLAREDCIQRIIMSLHECNKVALKVRVTLLRSSSSMIREEGVHNIFVEKELLADPFTFAKEKFSSFAST